MANTRMSTRAARQDELDEAFDRLEREVPSRVARAIRWMRTPQARFVRLPLGILCVIGGFAWFLPLLGLWLLPVGLLLLAQDAPFLRRRVGKLTLYLLDRWAHVRNWWRAKRA